MSGNPTDDQQDDAVDSAWRREFREEPSATTDAVIRAAARRELASRREPRVRRGWRGQWTPFAAAAAVGVLAFGLVRWLPFDHEPATVTPSRPVEPDEHAPQVSSPGTTDRVAPTPTPSEDAAERVSPPEAQAPSSSVPAPTAAGERRERLTGPSPAPFESADEPQAQQTPIATQEAARSTAGAEAEVSSRSTRPGVVAPAAKTAERPEAEVSTATRETVRRITELHTAGRLDEAAEALRKLRTIEPQADDLLPADLRPWAVTVTD